jgi:hypothetical protein
VILPRDGLILPGTVKLSRCSVNDGFCPTSCRPPRFTVRVTTILLAPIMQLHFFLPAIPAKRKRTQHPARTRRSKNDQATDKKEPSQSLWGPHVTILFHRTHDSKPFGFDRCASRTLMSPCCICC